MQLLFVSDIFENYNGINEMVKFYELREDKILKEILLDIDENGVENEVSGKIYAHLTYEEYLTDKLRYL